MNQKLNWLLPPVGKYGRPMFWAVLMSSVGYGIFGWLISPFTREGKEFFTSFSVGDYAFLVFALLFGLVLFVISVFWLAHPYFPYKETEESKLHERDTKWGVVISLLVVAGLLQIALQYFVGFNLYSYLGFF